MAEPKTQQPRTFVKKVGDETFTRQITSVQAEVEAKFDGYTEQAAKPAGSGGRPSSSGSGG